MAQRQVTRTRKDQDGDITALCNYGKGWSPRQKADAVRDIRNNRHNYYVKVRGRRVDIHVVNGHLRTDPDVTTTNNLDDLPDC